MARKVRTHLFSVGETGSSLEPRHLSKQEFGKRLYNLMLRKGWNQSELARQAGIQRDSVSTYINGRSLPTPKNLLALSTALGVEAELLLPNHTEEAIEADETSFSFKVSPSQPNTAWLRVNRLVTLATAVKIAELLENDNATDTSRSR